MTKKSDRLTNADPIPVSVSLPIARVLANSSAELKRLALMVHDVEAAIFDIAGTAEVSLPVRSLHSFDFVVQTLGELAEVFSRLADATSEEMTVDESTLIGPVRLGLLRQALTQQLNSPSHRVELCAQKIELF